LGGKESYVRIELENLLARMCVAEPGVNSADSVSWRAYRQAETLSDFDAVEELVTHLSSTPNKEQRQAAYFIIGKIGLNTKRPECAQVLIQRIPLETDKHVLATLLDALAGTPKQPPIDLSPIYGLLRDSRWLVRHSAIGALKHTSIPDAETKILELLAETADPLDMAYCNATLNSIGSERALPALEHGLKSRKRDVKISAKFAIEAIQKRVAAQQGAPGDRPRPAGSAGA